MNQPQTLRRRYWCDTLEEWAAKDGQIDAREREIAGYVEIATRTDDPRSVELVTSLAGDVRNAGVAFEEARAKFVAQIDAVKAADEKHEAARREEARGTLDAKQAVANHHAVIATLAAATFLEGTLRGFYATAESARQRVTAAALAGVDRQVISETIEVALDLAENRVKAAQNNAERFGRTASEEQIAWYKLAERLAVDTFKARIAERKREYEESGTIDPHSGKRVHDWRRIPPTFATVQELEQLFALRRSAREAERRRVAEQLAALGGAA
jgi:hypothetical protein